METQQQTDPENESPLMVLTPEDIAERMVGCKVAMLEGERYYRELEAEMLARLEAGEVLDINYPFTIDTGEVVNKTVSIRHQRREGWKYNEKQVIKQLKETVGIFNPQAYIVEVTTERIDRDLFEEDLFKDPAMEPLRRFVKKSASDWCVVTGVPK